MRNLFQKNSPKPNLPRNVFDLSQHRIFSAKAGMLLPCYVDEVNPNESYRIDVNSFLRTQPLTSAAYARFNQRVDFFFVPLRLLCRNFSNALFGTDFKTSNMQASSNTPTFARLGIYPFNIVTQTLVKVKDTKDAFGCNLADNACRLLDLLGYGSLYYCILNNLKNVPAPQRDGFTEEMVADQPFILPFRLGAYQKIYQDFFRNTDYELSSAFYNFDSFLDTDANLNGKYSLHRQLLTMRYANVSRDYFSATHPNFQGSAFLISPTSFNQLNVGQAYQYVGNFGSLRDGDVEPSPTDQFAGPKPQTHQVSGQAFPSVITGEGNIGISDFIGAGSTRNGDSVSALSIRAAFALDKLYRQTIEAADGSYSAQVLAHYGYSMKHDPYKSIYLGGMSKPVQISEVVTTANTSDGQTGDLFGRGLSLGTSNTINFTSNEHGILMGIFSIVPENLYPSTGVEKQNISLRSTDWFIPEFDRLGYQPIAISEISPINTNWTKDPGPVFDAAKNLPAIVGFTPRYAQYKTKVDKCFYPFYDFDLGFSYASGQPNIKLSGSLRNWTAPRFTKLSQLYSNQSFLSRKVIPSVTDSISSILDDGTIDTDFIIVNMDITCKAMRNMSVDGQPIL